MQINAEDLRRHYALLSDEALLAIDRSDLVEMARTIYDEEIGQRGLNLEEEYEDPAGAAEGEAAGASLDDEGETAPAWLEEAACAAVFTATPGAPYVEDVAKARATLRAAGIPCHVILNETEGRPPRQEYWVMVPGALNLHAISVLDRDLYNPIHEADWRTHLEMLSDAELRALEPEIFCAGLLDRVERLKRVYREEIEQRRLKAR